MALRREDFIDDAQRIGCEVEVIQAVAAVESSGSGFCPDGFPVTLFEGHWFHRLTNGIYTAKYPTVSYPKWTKQFYGKSWGEERSRLNLAISLDRTAALQSASWGMFQIMGFNHIKAGFSDVQKFVNAMCVDENLQMQVFTNYVLNSGLDDELRAKDWKAFAKAYNGPEYYKNNYDIKLEAKYKQLLNRA